MSTTTQPKDSQGRLRSLWNELRETELAVLIACALILGGVWGFILLTSEVLDGSTARFDTRILLALRNPADVSDPLGPPWLEEMGRDLTALGGVAFLILLTCAVYGYLALQGRHGTALFLVIAVVGGTLIGVGLKDLFLRPRPQLVPHGSIVYTASFPSGHSMLSTVTYLTLGSILAEVHKLRRMKIYLLFWASLLALLVGISRIYLGVHWPTDVLGGWTAGFIWAMFCWLAAHWLRQRNREPEIE